MTIHVGKLAKKIDFLKRISKSMTIYDTIIKPHFEYVSTILYSSTAIQLIRMQKLQNKTMRVIFKCDRYTHINTML